MRKGSRSILNLGVVAGMTPEVVTHPSIASLQSILTRAIMFNMLIFKVYLVIAHSFQAFAD